MGRGLLFGLLGTAAGRRWLVIIIVFGFVWVAIAKYAIDIFGPGDLAQNIGLFLGPVVGAALGFWLYRVLPGAPKRRPALRPGEVLLYGDPIEAPAFFSAIFANRDALLGANVFHYGKGHVLVRGQLAKIGRGPVAESRLMESFYESARLEYVKRGAPIKDRLGKLSMPRIFNDGVVVEEIDNGDGTISQIMANGLLHGLSDKEWVQANDGGFGELPLDSAWDEKPPAKMRVAKQGGGSVTVDYTSIALFHLNLFEHIVAAGGADQRDETVQFDVPDEWR